MRIVTFGEVMMRLAPPEFLRLRQAIPGSLEATFGGGELNVAVSIAMQGLSSAFLTALPDNVLTDTFVQELRKLNVADDLVRRYPRGRFGIYYVETGANQRGGTVTYDRAYSSISMAEADWYDFPSCFRDAHWLHVTGITPAISRNAAEATKLALQEAKRQGLTVSCDLNFRRKLWRWDEQREPVELARRTMRELMPFVDVVVANEEDAELALGIAAPHSDVEEGRLNRGGYEQVARRIVADFPNVSRVAITLRESLSASHNNWGAMFFDAAEDRVVVAPVDREGRYRPYEIRNIVDRVGAGDAFAGALIVALNTPELADCETALRYAVAASCLKHSIRGDFNYVSRVEIESLMKGSGSGRVQR